jgi:hypothetical protein
LRIDSRVQTQSFGAIPQQDKATELRAAELQAQAAQPLQQNPALQAFRGESSFEGAGGVQAPKMTGPKAVQGMRGLEAPDAAQGTDGKDAPQGPSLKMGPLGYYELPEWFKVLWNIPH